jgi:hypothetical protein
MNVLSDLEARLDQPEAQAPRPAERLHAVAPR